MYILTVKNALHYYYNYGNGNKSSPRLLFSLQSIMNILTRADYNAQ